MFLALLAQTAPSSSTIQDLDPYLKFAGDAFLATLVLFLFLTRRVVVGSLYEDKARECDLTREALEKQRERGDALERQYDLVVEQNKTVIHLLESIKEGPRK